MAMQYWYQYVYSDLLRRCLFPEASHWRTLWPLPFWFYGDDLIGLLPSYAYEYVTGIAWVDRKKTDKPLRLHAFLNDAFGLKLKMSDCAVFLPYPGKDPLLTEITVCGTVAREGPKFLQRRFVHILASDDFLDKDPTLYSNGLMSLRVVQDYWARASTTVNGTTWAAYLLKLRGLAVDTAGVNVNAYRFIKHLHDAVCKAHPECIEDLEKFDLANDRDALEFRRRVADANLPYEMMRDFPDYTHLQFHYWPRRSHCRELVARIREGGLFPHLYA